MPCVNRASFMYNNYVNRLYIFFNCTVFNLFIIKLIFSEASTLHVCINEFVTIETTVTSPEPKSTRVII